MTKRMVFLRHTNEVAEFLRDHPTNPDLCYVMLTGRNLEGKFTGERGGLTALKMNCIPLPDRKGKP